jgi:predicted NUDIX family phosphoesterase
VPERAPSFAGNAYLALAYEALKCAGHPLSPAQMLRFAKENNFLPSHLHGKTMHKTLAARLAEHIRSESQRSEFYRTGPATFFAHTLAAVPGTPDEFRQVFVGNLRAKSIRKENVLVARREMLQSNLEREFTDSSNFDFEVFFRENCFFMDRAKAEKDDSVKQFVTFTLIFNDWKILIYRRGKFTTTSDRLKGQLSVGFGGHVNDLDFTLFDQGADAFRGNACRELREELFLDEIYDDPEDAYARTEILGYLNTDDSPDAEHHLAVLVAFNHVNDRIPRKGELSINQLSWLDLRKPRNDLSDFDLWSEKILRELYQGSLALGA